MAGKVLIATGTMAWTAALSALALALFARLAGFPLIISFHDSYEAYIYPSRYVVGVSEGRQSTETVLNLRVRSNGHPVAYAIAEVTILHTDGSKSTVWIGPTNAYGRASAWVPLRTSQAGIVEFRAKIVQPESMPYEMSSSLELVTLK